MKRGLTFFFGMYTVLLTAAQENLGIRNSNYAGVQGLFLNPSSMADSKLKWDVNGIAVGTIFDNDFFFIHKNQVPPLGFRKIVKGVVDENLFDNHFDPGSPNKKYNLTLSSEVIGPSFYTEIAPDKYFGFTIATRAYFNNNNVPGHLAQNAYTDLKDKDLWNTDWHDNTSTFNSMGWMEYGLHYASVLFRTRTHA